jgi:hypothetical protein
MVITEIINFVDNESIPLFRTIGGNNLLAVFDNRGFFLSQQAQEVYDKLKHEPHLYVATGNGYFYVGKSFQLYGRWRRSNAYHLRALTHELLGSNYKDHRHAHWNRAWMDLATMRLSDEGHSIMLISEVRITFIPFKIYSGGLNFCDMPKADVKILNHNIERDLIQFYILKNCDLLNVQR